MNEADSAAAGITLPPVRKRRSLPRAMRVALTLSKGTVTLLIILLVAALAASFGAGIYVGKQSQRPIVAAHNPDPVPVPVPVPTKALVQDTTQPIEAPKVIEQPQPVPTPEKPKLKITVGPPDDSSAFGIQIGAYPDLGAAEASLDARVAAVSMFEIYIVPAEIKGKGVWHRVRLGTFKTKAEAEKARAALPETIAKEAMVVSYK